MTQMLGHVVGGTPPSWCERTVVVGQLCVVPGGLGVAQKVEGENSWLSTAGAISGAIVCAIGVDKPSALAVLAVGVQP